MIKYVATRGEAYHWGMLTWFNQFLLEQRVVTEGEFRQMRQKINASTEREKGQLS